jgi:hypothetical protein
MRFALAVLAAAVLDLAVFLRIEQWFGIAALLAIGYIFAASAGAGFFAGRRPALAGALAVLGGALLAGLVQYAPRATYANDFGVLFGWELQLVTAVIPYAIGGAIAGQLGGVARRRVMPARTATAPAPPAAKTTKP